ncbi:MAG: glycosyltransferase family 2 protein [Lachnospiraceae bacterium]|nr:glycosyltransferase family 2 protein [Lachnospiraceae bacterium]
MADLTVIILTKNEELNIKKCIENVKPIAKRIVVVDSYSTDRTIDIAKELGAEIYQHPFKHYGAQFQWAIDNCNIKTQWVFRLDADEEVSAESRNEIEELCEKNRNTDINGFVFRQIYIFMGRKIKHGSLNILKKLCIFKYGKACMEDRYMGEQIVLTEGRSIDMKTLSYHHDFKNMTFLINKMNWYATREVKDIYIQDEKKDQEINTLDVPSKVRRAIKYKVYYKMPSRMRAKMFFFYCYILRGGFLDGKEGYYFYFFEAYFYHLLVDAKQFEAEKTGIIPGETGAWN